MSVKWHVALTVEVLATDVADAEMELWKLLENCDNLDDIKKECAGYAVTNIGVTAEEVEDDTD